MTKRVGSPTGCGTSGAGAGAGWGSSWSPFNGHAQARPPRVHQPSVWRWQSQMGLLPRLPRNNENQQNIQLVNWCQLAISCYIMLSQLVIVNNQTCVQTVCISSNILWQIRQFSTLIHISIMLHCSLARQVVFTCVYLFFLRQETVCVLEACHWLLLLAAPCTLCELKVRLPSTAWKITQAACVRQHERIILPSGGQKT